jgi:hypothetical protein
MRRNLMRRFLQIFWPDIEKSAELGNSGACATQTCLAQAVPPNRNATLIGALSKRKIRWQRQNPMIPRPSPVNFKKFMAAPSIIQRLITSTIQPRSSSYAAVTGRSNNSLAFTFEAARVAVNVLQNAANRPHAKSTISKFDHQLQS